MVLRERLIILSSMFFILIFLSIETVSAKSYSYPYIKMSLGLEKDGSITVSQERAYDFRGSFSWAFLDLKKKGASDVDFIEIRDLDTNELLLYDIEEDNDHVKATWHYKADNQVKKFLIVYEIKDAVKRYNDVADFYWKVIEDEHEAIRNFNAEVYIPEPSSNLFKLFVHSAAKPGTMTFSDDYKKVSVVMQDIPKDRFVEFRLLTSPSIFSDVGLIGENKYENILNEEKLNLVQSSISGSTGSIFFYPILTMPLVIIFLYFYFKYGVEPKVKYEGIYERDPPMKIPPMALAHLVGGRFEKKTRGFIATIFDLARKGYLNVKEEKKTQLKFFEKKEQKFILTKKGKKELTSPKKLLDFELSVLKFLFQVVPSGKSIKKIMTIKRIYPEVTSSDIIDWNRKKRSGLSFINSLHEQAASWFESKHFRIYTKLSMAKRNLFLIVSITYLILISVFLILIRAVFIPWIIVGGLIIGLLLIFASIPILRKTPEATLELKKWRAFRRFITDFSAMKDAPATLIHIWDEYLIYAVVLGVAVKLLKVLRRIAEEQHVAFAAAGWYYGAGVTRAPTGVMSPESFSSLVSNLSGTISALSSSTSVGGGFSGGGGGGGGGGASGAG